MNVVMIVPTGIGCAIGGHAGDATPAARLLGACCDKLILHPNVVNASEINEMPPNSLYVEGSMLDLFLEGEIGLREVKSNKILVVTNPPLHATTQNCVNAARMTLGIDAEIFVLPEPVEMIAEFVDGRATGTINGVDVLLNSVGPKTFDALAIHTEIKLDDQVALNYFEKGGVNPYGGVEAVISKLAFEMFGKPVAHAPLDRGHPDCPELDSLPERVVDPRMAAEAISNSYLFSVLKGLHKAPQSGKRRGCIKNRDVDAIVVPLGCYGRAHKAAEEADIPIIAVRENLPTIRSEEDACIRGWQIVANYCEAAGVLMCMRHGINPLSTRNP